MERARRCVVCSNPYPLHEFELICRCKLHHGVCLECFGRECPNPSDIASVRDFGRAKMGGDHAPQRRTNESRARGSAPQFASVMLQDPAFADLVSRVLNQRPLPDNPAYAVWRSPAHEEKKIPTCIQGGGSIFLVLGMLLVLWMLTWL